MEMIKSGDALFVHGQMKVELTAEVGINFGIGSVKAGNTLSFTSITFPDGLTQENHGFDIVFESGRTSPNLSNIDPVPNAKVSSSDGPVTIAQANNLTVTLVLDSGSHSGEDADWWVVADTPFGWFHYDVVSGSWMPGLTHTHQGPLFDLTPPIEALNVSGCLWELYFLLWR